MRGLLLFMFLVALASTDANAFITGQPSSRGDTSFGSGQGAYTDQRGTGSTSTGSGSERDWLGSLGIRGMRVFGATGPRSTGITSNIQGDPGGHRPDRKGMR